MRTIGDILKTINTPQVAQLSKPIYSPPENEGGIRIALAVKSMANHTSNEGWELMLSLQHSGYELCGYGIDENLTDVNEIIERYNPAVVVVQDKREYIGKTAGKGFDERERFINVGQLRLRPDIFRLTVLKDAHQDPQFHSDSANEIGCHAWITYYHPEIVCKFAPYVRREHLVRTYHSLDAQLVPTFSANRHHGCLLSGAISRAYPLRTRLFREARYLSHTTALPHPGYHRNGSATPKFLQILSNFKVAICTASSYGYVLRKMIEATACGCTVITDLPSDEVLPQIDGNMVRVDQSITTRDMNQVIRDCVANYNVEKQVFYAEEAKKWYDYRVQGTRLAANIEKLRRMYNET